MKKSYIITALYIILSLFVYENINSYVVFWTKIGRFQSRVFDNGNQSFSVGNKIAQYYFNFSWTNFYRSTGMRMGARDWTDQNGTYHAVKFADFSYGDSEDVISLFAKPDTDGLTIHRYWRYAPPSIVVDGVILNDPFPQVGEEVAPDKIPGTAEVMVQSYIGSWLGVDVNRKVFYWSQRNHDDYAIYEWTITNTGNVDQDAEIELPDNTLLDFYFLRELQFLPNRGEIEWITWDGCRPGEPLRIMYAYPARQVGHTWDRFGGAQTWGCLRGPIYGGEAYLHAPTSVDNPTNDQSQPRVHYVRGADDQHFMYSSYFQGEADLKLVYEIMQNGHNIIRGTPYMEGTYPETKHEVPMDERGGKYLTDYDWWYWHGIFGGSCGPYPIIKVGESLNFVWATLGGSISPEMAWIKGGEWLSGTIEPPPGMVFNVTDNLPGPYKFHPSLYEADSRASEYSNWAKDCWIATGKDSLFQNGINALKNFQSGYNVPTAPPPPSIEINSRPDRVEINWGTESEVVSDFAGYRVFRAVGRPGLEYNIYSDREYHPEYSWKKIFECGKGTANALTHTYDDATAERGKAYFYYVVAFDDGIGNITDVNGKKEVLESGEYLNMTSLRPAYLTREPGAKLSDIRVVPNPFNINAEALQYPGEPDKIMFLDLPGYCTIKIYSESGDLVKTLYHTSGSGDESWGVLLTEHSTTDSGQLIVSGIYIAVIIENNEDGTPTGNKHYVKFAVVR